MAVVGGLSEKLAGSPSGDDARARVRATVASRLGAGSLRAPAGCVVGLIGRAIGPSRSPAMHEREGARVGIPYAYVLLDFDDLGLADSQLPDVLAEAEALGFTGLNVTHPYKQSIVAHLHALSPEAAAIGAVNTVLFNDGRRTGHNTDGWAFARSFREELPGAPVTSVVQFGAGGAGAAVAYALLTDGVGHVALVDIDRHRADALAARLASHFGGRISAEECSDDLFARADGIINATPMGMEKYPGVPFPHERLDPRHWVAEIVYFPLDTALLRVARSVGCRTLPGTGMAVYQAARAFELFTGVTPDRDSMFEHFRAGGP